MSVDQLAQAAQQPVPWPGARTYDGAIEALNSLQSNASFIEAKRKAGPQFVDGLPLETETLRRIGYGPTDLNKLNVIHITGTKGKGSTSAFCDALLRQAAAASVAPGSKKIGLYTSPHMIAARERIRINGLPLEEETFARYFFEVWDRLAQNPERQSPDTPLRPLYFRFLTALCFHVFLSETVDAVILEVGIGGRYDSTNIVPRPVVTGITSLGIDHTFMLGDTIEKIAWQKGGIYKKDVPAISVQQDPKALKVLEMCAEEAQADGFTVLPSPHDLPAQLPQGLGLPGAHQATNASLAVALVRTFLRSVTGNSCFPEAAATMDAMSPSSSKLFPFEIKALESARWPGRCQVVPSNERLRGITWYLDGAHTTDSLELCVRWLVQRTYSDAQAGSMPKRVIIFNCTSGRSASQLLASMLDEIERGAEPQQSHASKTEPQQEQQGRLPYPKARKFFDQVFFCTNTTYSDGMFKGDLMSKAVDPSDLNALTIQRELQQAWNELLGLRGAASASGAQAPDVAAIRSRVDVLPSIQHAINAIEAVEADSAAAATEGVQDVHVLVTGSLHLVGGVMAHLKDRKLLDDALVSVHQVQQAQSVKV